MTIFKKVLIISGAFVITACTAAVSASAEQYGNNTVSDHFSITALKGDTNHDGYFDIKDLVRAKKVLSQLTTDIDMDALNKADNDEVLSSDLISISKWLLS